MKLANLHCKSIEFKTNPDNRLEVAIEELLNKMFAWMVINSSKQSAYGNQKLFDLFSLQDCIKYNEFIHKLPELIGNNQKINQWQYCKFSGMEYIFNVIHDTSEAQYGGYLAIIFLSVMDFEQLIPLFGRYSELKDNLMIILDNIYDGVFVTDGEGNIILVNKASVKSFISKQNEDLIGKNLKDLVKEGCCSVGVSLKVIEEGRIQTLMQKTDLGTKLLTTGVPYYKDGKINMVICCEREISHIIESLKKELTEKQNVNDQYKRELDYFRSIYSYHDDIIAESKEMKKVVELAYTAAKFEPTVLIIGESGVGKEVIANLIYRNSPRCKGPFIKINCGAIPEELLESELFGYKKGAFTGANKNGKIGLLELANHGIIFLDEIGELSLKLQVKLLRVIQEKEIIPIGGEENILLDIQIIAATNRDIKEAVKKGGFRTDLYYRLNVFPIQVPPLRDRKDDIVPLVNHFIHKSNYKYGLNREISPKGLKSFKDYEWPGNIRELENILERLVLISKKDLIDDAYISSVLFNTDYLSTDYEQECSLEKAVDQFEKQLLTEKIQQYKGTSELCKSLKVSRSTLNRKLLKYGLINNHNSS